MYLCDRAGGLLKLPERPLEPPKEKPRTAEREEQMEYCFDYFADFVELAESYIPDIVTEFCKKFDWRYEKWKKDGVTVRFGGSGLC